MERERKLRVLVAKPGLDGHDRGARIIARGLRDAGFEVIYTGVHQTPEQIVNAAIQEDVDLVGLSCLSGAHLHLFSKVVRQLRVGGAGDITVIGGGIIPEEDIPRLKKAGIKHVFLPGTPIVEIVDWTLKNVRPDSSSDSPGKKAG
ncbi:MAG: cobalamin B12-binding domain-containing protein [Anaerolineales bacterium]|nr:cobalamin B12-binding domain-containing protein [Anaerolineales bacterium]